MPDVTTMLDGLSQADQKLLFDQLAYRLQGRKRAKVAADLTPEEQMVWEAMVAAVGPAARSYPPLPTFLEQYGRKKYAEAVAQVMAYVDEGCGVVLRRPVRLAVLQTVFSCLKSHLKARSIPLTPSVFFNSMLVLPSAVERRFPGYVEARLLHRVAPAAVTT